MCVCVCVCVRACVCVSINISINIGTNDQNKDQLDYLVVGLGIWLLVISHMTVNWLNIE